MGHCYKKEHREGCHFIFLHYLCTHKTSRACGEIGRRARLRIWCFATCRFESYHAHDWTKEEFSKQGIPLSCFENRQYRQRLVKRRTGEARTVWAAIRRRCQFKRYNRQRKQQKVTRSTAECGAAWVAKSECCQFYYQNRQCRQRLVKRRTGEARTVWAAIRRRCQFKRYNRQCEQQKVTRSTAPVVPRGLRLASVVNFKHHSMNRQRLIAISKRFKVC